MEYAYAWHPCCLHVVISASSMKKLFRSLCFAAALTSPAAFAATAYTLDNYTDFASQVSGITNFGFADILTPIGQGSSDPINGLLVSSAGNVVSIVPETTAFVLAPSFFAPADGPYGNINIFSSQNGSSNSIAISPGAGIFALGIYFGTYGGPAGGPLGVNVDGTDVPDAPGHPITFPASVAGSLPGQFTGFVGVISSTPIGTVTFTPGQLVPGTFDLTGIITAVPEPSTPAMLLIGLALVGACVRRRTS